MFTLPLDTRFRTAISFRTYTGFENLQSIRERITYHVLPSFHELLIDDLAGIVFTGTNVNGLFNNSVRPTSESPSSTVLRLALFLASLPGRRTGDDRQRGHTWQGTVTD